MNKQLKILACGNVDDGKSTLLGHMIFNSKTMYLDQTISLKKESENKNCNNEIDYSLVFDGLDEEREQGITIDIAYKYFSTDKRSFIILDAPGHEEYTRNMAVGASQAELVILLIDATKGITMQTRRHIKICIMMGIRDFVVAINKMDLINYDKQKFESLKCKIHDFFDLYNLDTLKVIPVSAKIGDNISDASINMSWYNGETLLEYLENIKIKEKNILPFVLPVQRVCHFDKQSRGFQGNIVSGIVSNGQQVFCLPSGEYANIKNIFNLNNEVSEATCGQAVTITLDREIDVSRGCLLTNDFSIELSNNFDATILWMDDEKLRINNSYYLKIGTKELLCYIRRINYKIDINTGDNIETQSIFKNDIANCNIECLEKIPLTIFEYNNYLGRLILINRITHQTSCCAIINRINKDDSSNLFYHETNIDRNCRAKKLNQKPITIWFTGLSCSGKSTIANELEKLLVSHDYHTMLLDGDNIRLGINSDLKFSTIDRKENIRRVAHISKLFNDAGIICITSFITPLNINRNDARKIIGENFFLIYVNTDIDECEKRDKKGLYKKARNGIIKDFTGINSPFEEPKNPDIIVYNYDAKECAMKIYNAIKDRI